MGMEEHLKRYIVDYRNYEGFKVLVGEYGLSVEDSDAFLRGLVPLSNPLDKRYDVRSGKHLTLEEWINSKLQGPSWFRWLLTWFRWLLTWLRVWR